MNTEVFHLQLCPSIQAKLKMTTALARQGGGATVWMPAPLTVLNLPTSRFKDSQLLNYYRAFCCRCRSEIVSRWANSYLHRSVAAKYLMRQSKTDSRVPCFCKLCNGRLVSRYLRRKHKQAYVGVSSKRSPPRSLLCLDHSATDSATEDIQSMQAVQPVQNHANPAISQGAQQSQEGQLQAINDEEIDVFALTS